MPDRQEVPESTILRAVQLAATKRGDGTRLLRNNCGVLQDRFGKYVKYGVANPGGSDLIGWTIRNGLAIFTAIEVKRPSKKATPEQIAFIDAVRKAGGIAGVAHSVEEAMMLLDN